MVEMIEFPLEIFSCMNLGMDCIALSKTCKTLHFKLKYLTSQIKLSSAFEIIVRSKSQTDYFKFWYSVVPHNHILLQTLIYKIGHPMTTIDHKIHLWSLVKAREFRPDFRFLNTSQITILLDNITESLKLIIQELHLNEETKSILIRYIFKNDDLESYRQIKESEYKQDLNDALRNGSKQIATFILGFIQRRTLEKNDMDWTYVANCGKQVLELILFEKLDGKITPYQKEAITRTAFQQRDIETVNYLKSLDYLDNYTTKSSSSLFPLIRENDVIMGKKLLKLVPNIMNYVNGSLSYLLKYGKMEIIELFLGEFNNWDIATSKNYLTICSKENGVSKEKLASIYEEKKQKNKRKIEAKTKARTKRPKQKFSNEL